MTESEYIWKQDKIGTLIKITVMPSVSIISGLIAVLIGNQMYVDHRIYKPQSIICLEAIFCWLWGAFWLSYTFYLVYGVLTEKKGDWLRQRRFNE